MPVLRLQRIAQIQMRFGLARVDGKSRFIVLYRFVEAIERLQCTSQVVVHAGIVRPERKRLLYERNALQRLALLDIADSKQMQCHGFGGIRFNDRPIQLLRFAYFPRHVRFYRPVKDHA